MAYIQKVKRRQDVAYRVYIKKVGVKRISKTFNTKRLLESLGLLLSD